MPDQEIAKAVPACRDRLHRGQLREDVRHQVALSEQLGDGALFELLREGPISQAPARADDDESEQRASKRSSQGEGEVSQSLRGHLNAAPGCSRRHPTGAA